MAERKVRIQGKATDSDIKSFQVQRGFYLQKQKSFTEEEEKLSEKNESEIWSQLNEFTKLLAKKKKLKKLLKKSLKLV